jgi:3-oxoacyl-[acyl-carrier protein] reductase
MTSDLSFSGREQFSGYCASKGAINAMTKSWAKEFAPEVLVNAIAPGPIDTDMLGVEQMSPEWRTKEEELTVMKRIGRPEEVASIAVLLAGPGGSYLTGQIIGPNGGSVMP